MLLEFRMGKNFFCKTLHLRYLTSFWIQLRGNHEDKTNQAEFFYQNYFLCMRKKLSNCLCFSPSRLFLLIVFGRIDGSFLLAIRTIHKVCLQIYIDFWLYSPSVHTCPHLPDTHIWNIRFQLLFLSLKDVIKSDFFFTKLKKKILRFLIALPISHLI